MDHRFYVTAIVAFLLGVAVTTHYVKPHKVVAPRVDFLPKPGDVSKWGVTPKVYVPVAHRPKLPEMLVPQYSHHGFYALMITVTVKGKTYRTLDTRFPIESQPDCIDKVNATFRRIKLEYLKEGNGVDARVACVTVAGYA